MNKFVDIFKNKKIFILGFGLEGKSTYKTIRTFLPELPLAIADKKDNLKDIFESEYGHDNYVELFAGDNYLKEINDYDIVIKSPGISYKALKGKKIRTRISSQTELFITLFKDQIIGITGTKGKSTTTSLLMHIFMHAGKNALLAGNIGIPPFNYISNITKDTIIAFEMSSHQLENIKVSPHIAVLLNIYQEHLDHYGNYSLYKEAKFNISHWQNQNDYFLVNIDNEAIKEMPKRFFGDGKQIYINSLSEDNNRSFCMHGNIYFVNDKTEITFENACINRNLKGEHNLINIQAAAVAAKLAGIETKYILEGIADFKGLAHRLETAAIINGAVFINDSISTIPEATIAALKTFTETSTLILGGYDRGINYDELIEFIEDSPVKNLIFIGTAGKRICETFMKLFPDNDKNIFLPESFENAIETAKKITLNDEVCLLSPAASSYDMFKNFEERGDKFRLLLNT
ncbi:MAG: UDP-N-acetylmuramoyl-L-alanine--D-glutamate ligase [Bacteroidota bacterium]